jgi:hypothetical protein
LLGGRLALDLEACAAIGPQHEAGRAGDQMAAGVTCPVPWRRIELEELQERGPAHPRLARLELAQMLEVEGGDPESCLRILRHEVGHAIDNAYQLRRRPTRRRLFGDPSTPYLEHYMPKPYSKRFVHHLDQWYAQSHPDEDFAETFAVWLDPQSKWATRYAGLPPQRKLAYMERLRRELARRRPAVTSRRVVDPVRRLRKTLGEHYLHRGRHRVPLCTGIGSPSRHEPFSPFRNLRMDVR